MSSCRDIMHNMARSDLIQYQSYHSEEGDLVRVCINVEAEEWRQYKKECKEVGITASAGVRQFVRHVLRSNTRNGE